MVHKRIAKCGGGGGGRRKLKKEKGQGMGGDGESNTLKQDNCALHTYLCLHTCLILFYMFVINAQKATERAALLGVQHLLHCISPGLHTLFSIINNFHLSLHSFPVFISLTAQWKQIQLNYDWTKEANPRCGLWSRILFQFLEPSIHNGEKAKKVSGYTSSTAWSLELY